MQVFSMYNKYKLHLFCCHLFFCLKVCHQHAVEFIRKAGTYKCYLNTCKCLHKMGCTKLYNTLLSIVSQLWAMLNVQD